MEHTRLGGTGLKISRLALGCMSYGDPTTEGVTMAQVALAWVLRNPAVCAPIVGATRPHHLPEAVATLELKLTGDEVAALEKPYTNRGPSWY